MVVPTCGRPAALTRCLAALRRQTLPVELVVVDDTDQRGPAAARNAGAGRASGEFVLFVDDDCEPAPDWAQRLTEALAAGSDVVAGAVVNTAEANAFASATQLIHDHLMNGSRDPFATTNNIGCRREVIASVPFDDSYPLSGEDRDWCYRLATAGFAIDRIETAVVRHHHELTLRSFVRKHVGYGRGWRRFRRLHRVPLQRGRWYWELLRTGFAAGLATGALVVVAQLATVYGALRG